ncbi:outer membrane protein [Bartonella sp. B39]
MNTKRLITASIFALISASATQAADVVIPHQPTPVTSSAFVAPAFTWTGAYIGGQVGGFSSKTDTDVIDEGKSVPLIKDLSPKLSGFEGAGLYAGSNIDLGDNFVFGVDTDLIWSGQKYTKAVTLNISDNTTVERAVARSGRLVRSAPESPASERPAPEQPGTSVRHAAGGVGADRGHHDGSPGGVGAGHGHYGGHPGGMGAGHYGGYPHGAHPHAVGHNPHSAEGMVRNGARALGKDNGSGSLYGLEQLKREISELSHGQDGRIEALSHTLKQNWVGATRLRIGFAADRFMPYISGGVAYTKLQDIVSVSFKKENERNLESNNLVDETKTMVGYTLGGGIDFAVLDNVILRAEYRYSDFGKKKFAKEKFEIDFKTNDFRVGVAYKF